MANGIDSSTNDCLLPFRSAEWHGIPEENFSRLSIVVGECEIIAFRRSSRLDCNQNSYRFTSANFVRKQFQQFCGIERSPLNSISKHRQHSIRFMRISIWLSQVSIQTRLAHPLDSIHLYFYSGAAFRVDIET